MSIFSNISAKDLQEKLLKNEKFRLIDVRDEWEFKIVRINNAEHFPLNRLSMEMDNLDKNQEIVAYCHHGLRSKKACEILIKNGFRNVKNLMGGIDEYSLSVNPDIKRY